ncbi:hypothetical protein LguiB_010271 [Lonicera macranthoides]
MAYMCADSANLMAIAQQVIPHLCTQSSAAVNLGDHATKLGGVGFFTSFFQWFACAAAIYLLILDRTNWRTNMLTSLLVPYIFHHLSFTALLQEHIRASGGLKAAFTKSNGLTNSSTPTYRNPLNRRRRRIQLLTSS